MLGKLAPQAKNKERNNVLDNVCNVFRSHVSFGPFIILEVYMVSVELTTREAALVMDALENMQLDKVIENNTIKDLQSTEENRNKFRTNRSVIDSIDVVLKKIA